MIEFSDHFRQNHSLIKSPADQIPMKSESQKEMRRQKAYKEFEGAEIQILGLPKQGKGEGEN